MSTILDALRKLEEEHRSRTADVRSRLLLSPASQAKLPRRRQPFWRTRANMIGILSLTLTGFAVGAGVMFWHSSPTAFNPEQDPAAPSVKSSQEKQLAGLPRASSVAPTAQEGTTAASAQISPQATQPTPQTQTKVSQPSSPEQKSPDSTTLDSEVALFTAFSPPEENDTVSAASSVQRSPFVASSSAIRDAPLPRSPATPSVQPSSPTLPRRQHMTAASPPTPSAPLQRPTTRDVAPPTSVAREVPATASAGTSLSFLQWSSDPERRIAFLRVNGGPLTMAHEGDTIGGYTVVEIRQNAVELQSGETKMTLRTP